MTKIGHPKGGKNRSWTYEETLLDFDLEKCEQLEKFLTDFVYYYNNERPAYALNYKSPVQFKIEQGF